MKDFWTWRKLALFVGIIGLGIIGLIIADQQDFLNGRANTQTSIGDGIPDPLAKDANIVPIKTRTTTTTSKATVKTPTIPTSQEYSEIDGIQSIKNKKK